MTIRTRALTTNRLCRGRRFLTAEGKANKEGARVGGARSQWRSKPIVGPVALEIALWWPDNRRRDLDNVKGLLDSLSGILYMDDKPDPGAADQEDRRRQEPEG